MSKGFIIIRDREDVFYDTIQIYSVDIIHYRSAKKLVYRITCRNEKKKVYMLSQRDFFKLVEYCKTNEEILFVARIYEEEVEVWKS